MNYLFLDVYKNTPYRISKDTAGGYGTANDLGDGLVGKCLSLAIKRAVHWPNLSFVQLMEQLRSAGHNCHYRSVIEGTSIHFIEDFDAVFICNSIVCFETEIAIAAKIAQTKKCPVFLCGTVFKHSENNPLEGVALLSGNYEFVDINLFSNQDSLINTLQKTELHTDVPNEDKELAPIGWGKNGIPLSRNVFLGGAKLFIPYIFNRGCPYSCAEYCTYPTSQGRKVFSPSIDQCINTLKFYEKSYGKTHVVFRDPVFSINIKKAKSLLHAIAEADLNMEFSAELHLRNLDDEFIQLAREAKFKTFKFGIESAFEHIRSSVKRISVDNDEQLTKIQQLKEQKIKSVGMFILAQPADDFETCELTIDYACKLNLNIAQFSVFTPYPGTHFHSMIRDDITADSFEDYTQFKLVYKHRTLEPKRVRMLLEKSYKSFLISKMLQ